jgi:hypothetical protein
VAYEKSAEIANALRTKFKQNKAHYHLSKKSSFYFGKISCSAIVVELGYLSILLTEPI